MSKINPELLDSLPPQDLEAERWVLGSVLLQPACLDDISEIIRSHDFCDRLHQRLFRRMVEMRDRDEPIDLGLYLKGMREAVSPDWKMLTERGGAAYIADLVQNIPHAAHARHYAMIVARKARYRKLVDAATATLQDAYAAKDDPEEILNAFERDVAESDVASGEDPMTMRDAVVDAIARIDAVHTRQQKAGLMTGLEAFDSTIGGLFRGELLVLAARPGAGKTSLACQIAAHFGERNRPVLFVSLEMSGIELATRMLCSRANVSSRKVRAGQLTASDIAMLNESSGPLASATIYIHDRARTTMADIRRKARRLKRNGLDLVVVDYLTRVTPTDRRMNRYEQIGEMTRSLKELSRELDVPLLCLAQLGRDADKESSPRLSHLRESGDIEADADVVAFIKTSGDRKDIGNSDSDQQEEQQATLQVMKNRNGETGDFVLTWIPHRTLFTCDRTAPPQPKQNSPKPFKEFNRYA